MLDTEIIDEGKNYIQDNTFKTEVSKTQNRALRIITPPRSDSSNWNER